MPAANASPLETQITRAGRRLFLQTLVNRLVWSWSAALALGVLWFLIQPFLIESPDPALRWSIAGAALGLATILAVVLAWRKSPSRLAAALALDERFGLKERVTTSLTLTPQQRETPVGAALLEDAQQRVAPLDVPSRFPIRLSWLASLVPLTAAGLVLAALFYEPHLGGNAKAADRSRQAPANAAEIEQARDKLKELPRDKAVPEKAKSEQLKEIEADIQRLANRPFETREDARERFKEMEAAEQKIQDRLKDIADEKKAVKDLLEEMNKKGENKQDGPGKDMQKALADGDLNRAKQEMEKLAEELREDKLNDKQKQDLQKQLEELKDKADQLAKEQQEKKPAEQREREKKLEQLIEEAKKEGRDPEPLKRELEQLRKDDKGLETLKELAQKFGDCEKCMKEGDQKGAAEKLQEAAEQAKQMGQGDKEAQDLKAQLQRLQEAKNAVAKDTKDGDGQDKGKGDGQAKGKDGQGDGRGQGDKGTGARPKGKPGDFNSADAREKGAFDPNKSMLPAGFAPGQNFKAKTGPEIAGEIKQASQAAPEAIEQQRIPRAKRDIAKDYYRNLGEQADKPK